MSDCPFLQTITLSRPTQYLGRNGAGKCVAVDIIDTDDAVLIRPVNSQGFSGSAFIQIPKPSIKAVADALTATTTNHRR